MLQTTERKSAGSIVDNKKTLLLSSITYLRVSFVLQVEHEKQLTHQALLRADTTEGVTGEEKEIMNTSTVICPSNIS